MADEKNKGMDRVVKDLLNSFSEIEKIKNGRKNEDFEHFCNYTIIANQYNSPFDFNDISTGGEEDAGIDGIGIIVNGNLVNSIDDINTLYKKNNYLEADFIFIQSKTSPKFKTGDILKFHHGVLDFFKKRPNLPKNDEVVKRSALVNKIIYATAKLKRNPNIKVFYISTGKKSDDENINAIINTHKENLRDLGFFENIDVEMLGADEIIKLYRKARTQISKSFKFERKINLPKIEGIDQAYYGVLPLKEFKKILVDDNDYLLNMFDDNVRDFQGPNKVNRDISETLESANPKLFGVLNNGVTIVADDAVISGDSITITDCQIVNGCQTSNVLFENRDNNDLDEISIPLRLIVTTDSDVRDSIIISTNSQTSIKKAEFSAMSNFQKGLELYYNARLKECGIYYERRSKQYGKKVERIQIINIKDQAKSYFSMFKKDAHLATTYFGKLATQMNKANSGLCDDNHKYVPYYMAGVAYYKLENLFRSNDIDKKFKKVRFYVLMLMLMIVTNQNNPRMNSKRETENFCNPIINKLLDDKICLRIFKKATDIIERSGADIDDKQKLKSKPMTDQIINEFNKDTDHI